MIFARDSPRLGEKNWFWKIWLGKFGRAALDFGYLNLVKYPPKLTYSAGSFRVKKFGFERAVSKLFILAPNKLVGPHGMHLGQFWPNPSHLRVNFHYWVTFRVCRAPKIPNQPLIPFFVILLSFLHPKGWNKSTFDAPGPKPSINSKSQAEIATKKS